ncbi:hypothetical protein GCM10023165_42070 [Variovorax defluvii]|uniref:TIR domain-containing protein n=1 Tax=Variovorax defluvii TaxID=913761 RepID=A0ABP8I6W3_9BURK
MRLFISHGTDKNKQEELDYLDALEAGLKVDPPEGGNPHEVLIDRTRIDAGDAWEGILHDMLAECQAALLVLSERALKRPWVLKESTILSFRKAREPEFPFFCVLLPGVTLADVNAVPSFAALRLDDIQAFAPGTPAGAVAAWVLGRLQTCQPPRVTVLDRLERAIEARLVQVNANELEALCERLLGQQVAWTGSVDRARLRARMLARGIVRGRLGGVGGVAGLMRDLRNAAMPAEHRRAVLELAASMWVDAEIAGRFGALVAEGTRASPPAAALNGARIRYSSRMVAWRALMPETSDYIYWVEGGGSDGWEDELVRRIRKAYRLNKEAVIDSDEQVDEVLRHRDPEQPVVYVLPPPVPDEQLLRALQTRFPRVVFILHTGATLLPAEDLPQGVVRLAPGMQLEVEAQRNADYAAALESAR